MKTQRLTAIGVLTAAALGVHYLESCLPFVMPLPGMKPGLTNVIVLLTLLLLGPSAACWVQILRLTLGAVFAGSFVSATYSFAGGILSLAVMLFLHSLLKRNLKQTRSFSGALSVIVISIFGALSHNLAQIAVGYAYYRIAALFSYLPYLLLTGMVTGLFVGLCGFYTSIPLRIFRKFQEVRL